MALAGGLRPHSVWFVALAGKHPERPPFVDAGLPGAWVPQVWRGGSVGAAGSRGAVASPQSSGLTLVL